MAKKKKAALICRVSTPNQIKLGLESQVVVLKKQAEKDGFEVPNELIFQEQISGLDANKPIRKSLQQLMDAIEEHKVDVCYTFELSRISRDPYNLVERVKWFTDRHIPLYIYDVEMWTLNRETKEEIESTTDYIFSAATYGKSEIKKIKKRFERSKNEIARAGLYVGHLSDGYCVIKTQRGKEIKIDEDRKDVIKRIFDLYTEGNTIDKIAEILNTDGVPTANVYRLSSPKFKGYKDTYRKKGSETPIDRKKIRWQGATISNYLRNRWYIGERTYNEGKYSIDPIIDLQQWNKVSVMLTDNSASFRSKKESTKHTYLLNGLLYCGKCGKRMYGHYTGLNNHYYCSSTEEGKKCGLRGVCKENIEGLIALAVKAKGTLDLVNGNDKQNAIFQFFGLNEKEKKKLKEQYNANEKQINKLNKDIEQRAMNIEEALANKITDKDRATYYDNIARKFEDDQKKYIKNRDKLIRDNLRIKTKLKKEVNLSKQVDRMIEEQDIHLLKELFKGVIEKILVYNLTPIINLIRVMYTNYDLEDFIYSYRLLKMGTIPLKYAVFNEDGLIYYDEKNNCLKSKKEGALFERNYISQDQLEEAWKDSSMEEIANLIGNPEFMWLEEEVDAKDLISYCLRSKGVPTFSRLEEPSEKAKEQEAKYKEWRKKYNNGLPTMVPYVVKDETYENIKSQKKHLYNRKYKIKKHKKLTDEDKKKMLAEIDKELALLSAKVKYLNREQAIKEYQKQKSNQ